MAARQLLSRSFQTINKSSFVLNNPRISVSQTKNVNISAVGPMSRCLSSAASQKQVLRTYMEENGNEHDQGKHSYSNKSTLTYVALVTAGAFVGVNVLKSRDSSVEAAELSTGKGSDASKMMLYWASGSPPCWRVMLTLEEKGIKDYPNKLLIMDKKENRAPEVLKLNPRGQVPTFSHDGNVVNESLAAVDYLEATFKKQGTQLLPDEASNLATVLQKKYEAADLFTKGMHGYVFYYFRKPEERDQAELESRLKTYREELAMWEEHFKQMGPNNYVAGKDFTMADVIFFPTLALMCRLGLRLDQYPNMKAYYEKTKQRPSVQNTWPPHWKEGGPQTHLAHV